MKTWHRLEHIDQYGIISVGGGWSYAFALGNLLIVHPTANDGTIVHTQTHYTGE